MSKNLVLAAVMSCIMAGPPAWGHDLDEFGEWSSSLKMPDNPLASCCGVTDAYWVDRYEASTDPKNPDGFRAMVKGVWIEVPAKKVIWDRVNPTGRGVIFLSMISEVSNPEKISGAYVFCFIPGSGV